MKTSLKTAVSNGYVVDLDNFSGIPITIVNDGCVVCTRQLSKLKDRNLTVPEFLAHPSNQQRNIAVLDEAQYDQLLKTHNHQTYFAKPAEVISVDTFYDYFGAMPTLRQGNKLGMLYFLMSEPLTGSIVRMCAHYDGVYLTKHVDYLAPETWISLRDFAKRAAA
tara:strand:+ start:194 stop:685 length:492 start_codon:yes stop_codon:yes gene_type:complete